jgi:aconitate hydratase
MAPEYGATMGFFPVDEKTIEYFKGTGRSKDEIAAFEAYFKSQDMFGVANGKDIDFTKLLKLDLGTVSPSLAGPKRPQDRIEISHVKETFIDLFSKPVSENGFNQPAGKLNEGFAAGKSTLHNGDVLIAAITSCTNTSNPGVLLAAGLLAKKAVEAGLTVPKHIKTSLAPGSRVVTEYLDKAGLLPYLEKLSFSVAAYGCTTCIGNAGDLAPEINEAIIKNDLICAAVLSGNRNFEARIHPNLKANFLASPPLVVAYAIAGNVTKDLMTEPVGHNKAGKAIFLGDIWPTSDEVHRLMKHAMNPKVFRDNYAQVKSNPGKLWEKVKGGKGQVYDWPKSTYIARPPFFDDFGMEASNDTIAIRGARALGLFGDSITTDHISPVVACQRRDESGL